ncbi:helix-turn-helix transcriptional regulator [Pengzhenrongella phosphoraccumulans]|uniref:helix-turn-helix transcriptional regulator n=1 Tax=Pengzhenrongella phosphoraccumulans TaxID=3114394 RepID=UPI00388D7433
MLPAPIDSRTHRVLSGVSRVAVLEVVRSDGPLDVQAISQRVGLHPNTVRAHLDQLMEARLVESSVSPRATPGRPRLNFAAVAGTVADPADPYRMLAGLLAGAVGASVPAPGAVAADLGSRWGHQAVRVGGPGGEVPDGSGVDDDVVVDRLCALLVAVGFEPAVAEVYPEAGRDVPGSRAADGSTLIELHRCPFGDVAREHRDVVCGVHLGLMQGALEQLHASTTAVRLEPFAHPDLCLVHLTPKAAGVQVAL